MELIAIDGLAGTGKSTLAKGLAQRLNLAYLDTGATFRMMALAAIKSNVDIDDEARVLAATDGVSIAFEAGRCTIGSTDVTSEIREERVSAAASRIAVHPLLRERLLEWQREWVAEHGPSVVEGRDVTSVVFPDAALKIYLEADSEVRALRRSETTSDKLERRDKRDTQRTVAPVRKVEDAVVIDTTKLTVAEVETRVAELWTVHNSSTHGIS